MKKLLLAIISLIVILSVTGCSTVNVKMPEGKTVKVSSKPFEKVTKEKRVFYILWGLVPLTNNDTADMLQDLPDNSEVAIRTEYTPMDFILGLPLAYVTGTTKTVYVDVK